MIKRIELKNFENHQHTIIEDLSEGFNLICGASNSGKTSYIRALKAICYQDFDPKSVRIGSKHCEIKVETDKGSVSVKRGKSINEWEVTDISGNVKQFKNVGKNIIPEAAEVLGLSLIKLGEYEIPANIMDQLEGHFLLSEVGGENSSGSLRAQILDEISGLSGIETLIKDISLDNIRWAREIKDLELESNTLKQQLHDEKVLAAESSVLAEVEGLIKSSEIKKSLVTVLEGIKTETEKIETELKEIKVSLSKYPSDKDLEDAKTYTATYHERAGLAVTFLQYSDEIETLTKSIGNTKVALFLLPDTKTADEVCDEVKKKLDMVSVFDDLVLKSRESERNVRIVRKNLGLLPDESLVDVESISNKFSVIDGLNKLSDDCIIVEGKKNDVVSKSKELEKELSVFSDEVKEILVGFKECPVCLRPITDEVLQHANCAN